MQNKKENGIKGFMVKNLFFVLYYFRKDDCKDEEKSINFFGGCNGVCNIRYSGGGRL